MHRRAEPFAILDFDVESRPLGWLGPDYMHQEITVVAWAWLGSDEVEVRTLTKDDRSRRRMLVDFRDQYDRADMVTGHYIRSYDLPLVNAMLIELGEPALGAKLASDTKSDLPPMKGVSKSQENLAEMFDVEAPKVHMTVPKWRRANRLTKQGIAEAVERARFDVLQNVGLREELIRRRLLQPPRLWRP